MHAHHNHLLDFQPVYQQTTEQNNFFIQTILIWKAVKNEYLQQP